jgi:hypothetical protein
VKNNKSYFSITFQGEQLFLSYHVIQLLTVRTTFYTLVYILTISVLTFNNLNYWKYFSLECDTEIRFIIFHTLYLITTQYTNIWVIFQHRKLLSMYIFRVMTWFRRFWGAIVLINNVRTLLQIKNRIHLYRIYTK